MIAKFMGLEYAKIGYTGTKYETPWQRSNDALMDQLGMTNVGEFFIDRQTNTFFEFDDIDYTRWDYLMPVVEKIEAMGHEISICEDRCDVTAKDDENGFIGSSCHSTKLKATYEIVVETIKWYESKK